MKNQFGRKCKLILSVIIASIVITTCTDCDKEKDEQKVMASAIEEQVDDLATETDEEMEEDEWNVDFEVVRSEYIYDEQRNEIEIYYARIGG